MAEDAFSGSFDAPSVAVLLSGLLKMTVVESVLYPLELTYC
jgi:hypothetical protein